jgi:16S rRNA (uracil1498-N3)-methyltransferase
MREIGLPYAQFQRIMNRFFVNQGDIHGNSITIRDRDDIKHISKVLRLSLKDNLEISDSQEFEYVGEIDFISQDEINLLIIDKNKFAREAKNRIDLFQGIPKQGKMEYIIQKSVEIGVNKIVPVFTERSVPLEKGNSANKVERWQKVSNEAAKQCKRGIIPQVSPPLNFQSMIMELKNYDFIILPYENETSKTLKDILVKIKETEKFENIENKNRFAVIIGPEGGFPNIEVEALVLIGAQKASLGKTILRTETAGAATLAMMMYELEL